MANQTTAQQLIEFRAELCAGGLGEDLINDLVRDAASTLVLNCGLQTAPLPQSTLRLSGPVGVTRGVGESKSPE